MDGSAVCSGYANTFYLFCKAAGLDCEYVRGESVPKKDDFGHAWNRVKVDGKWYYVDCTWDDPVGGHKEHKKYFMSETLWSDHLETGRKELFDENDTTQEIKFEESLVGDKNIYPFRK